MDVYTGVPPERDLEEEKLKKPIHQCFSVFHVGIRL
jgi:hypothetical protein